MSKSIKIDDATYKIVAEFAQKEDRPLSNALARLVKLGLNIAALQAPVMPVAPMPKVKKEDLATAKVTFEERPDFKEPEKWDKHAWPTV